MLLICSHIKTLLQSFKYAEVLNLEKMTIFGNI